MNLVSADIWHSAKGSGRKPKAKVWLSVLLALTVLLAAFTVFAGAEPDMSSEEHTVSECDLHPIDRKVNDYDPNRAELADIDFMNYITRMEIYLPGITDPFLPGDNIPELTTLDRVTFRFYYTLCGVVEDDNLETDWNASTKVHYNHETSSYVSDVPIIGDDPAYVIPADTDYILDDTKISFQYTSLDTPGHLYMDTEWLAELTDNLKNVDIHDEISVKYHEAAVPATKPSEKAGFYVYFPDEYVDDLGVTHHVNKDLIAGVGTFEFTAYLNEGVHKINIPDVGYYDGEDGGESPAGKDYDIVVTDGGKEEHGTHTYTSVLNIRKHWERYSDEYNDIVVNIQLNLVDGSHAVVNRTINRAMQQSGAAVSVNIPPRYPNRPGGIEVVSWSAWEVTDGSENFIVVSEDYTDSKPAESKPAELVFTNAEKMSAAFSKKSVGGTEELPGAVLSLRKIEQDEEGAAVEVKLDESWDWTSGTEEHQLLSLIPGDYKLSETTAPDNHLPLTTAITFKIGNDYKITDISDTALEVEGEVTQGNIAFTLRNDYTKVKIYKIEPRKIDPKAADNTSDLPEDIVLVTGAKMALFDEDNNMVGEPWVTSATDNPHCISKLAPGVYTLKELETPAGYLKADDMTIVVEAVGDEQNFWMVDDFTKLEIAKLDEDGNPVVGAELELMKGTKSIRKWTSKEEPEQFEKLEPGEYTLVENSAPDGFRIAANVTVTVEGVAAVQSASMVDKSTLVEIKKVDADTNETVVGAHLEVQDKDGNVVTIGEKELKWTTTEEAYTIRGLKNGTYKIVETEAPDGYVIAAAQSFTVTSASQSIVVKFKNIKTEVQLTKIDEKGNAMSGAVLAINDASGNQVGDSWTTDGTVHTVKGLKAGSYTLVELRAPDGYSIAAPVSFTVTAASSDVVTVTMQDVPNNIKLAKVDEDGSFLSGAGLGLRDAQGKTVKDKDGNDVADWTSGTGWHIVKGLPSGSYQLVETSVPAGYLKAEAVQFDVDAGVATIEKKMEDKLNSVDLAKVDEQGAPVAGATLRIQDAAGNPVKDKDGNVVPSWTTKAGDVAHTVEGLPAGTYYLAEVKAPAGYLKAAPVEFVVTEDAATTATIVSMTDEATRALFAKVDVNGSYVAQASLEIQDAEGKIVKDKDGNALSWTSGTSAKEFTGIPAGTYYLVETKAPAGYATAAKVEFTIPETVDPTKADQTVEVSMTDKQTKLKIYKRDIESRQPVTGADLELRDMEGNVVVLNGKKLAWTTDGNSYDLTGLPVGKYVLVETKAPNGYILAPDQTIEVKDTDTVQTFTMEDGITKVQISKQDITGEKELPGASLEIKDASGAVVETWVSTDKPHYIERLPVGTYTLTETSAPDGYAIANSIEFTVEMTGDVQPVTMKDDIIKVKISKKDITNDKELPGATLVITDANGDTVETWVSTNEPHYIEMLPAGDYTLTEISAPDGYVTAAEVQFTVTATAEIQTVTMVDDVTKVSISKKDMTNSEELPGATLVIKDAEGKEIVSWVSTDEPHYIEKLPVGTYTLTEITAPDGYVTAETITFEVEDSGEIKAVEMLDDITKVKISKKDMTNSEELPGATLQLHDAQGNLVEEWVSGDEPHYIPKLPVGEYTLTEITAPDGYVTAETVQFTVSDTGEIQTAEMLDDIIKVKISKVDITTKEELPGATLTLRKANGDLVEEWVSGNEPHYIPRLPVGTYTLTETMAPEGYMTAETITFTVEETGEIQTVVMEDDYTRLYISKKDMTNSEELPGATLQLHDAQGNLIEEWVSGDEPHYIEKLPVGDYTLTEITAPDGYAIAETVQFTVEKTGEIQTATMLDDIIKVQISKKDMTNSEELPGAKLQILDEEGKIVEEWISGNEPHLIEKLPVGKYTLIETTAPDGYVTAEEVEFTVTATGEIQPVEMFDDVTKVKVSKKDMTNGEELPGATLIVRDAEGNVVEEWISGTEPHYIEKLPVGKYYLDEIIAPDGYVRANTVMFEVADSGEIVPVEMVDDITRVKISKKDMTNSEELPGATLRLEDAEGNLIEEWISEDEPHYIEMLPVGDYVLTEISAPDGYTVAESVKFTVANTGEIQTFTMFDDITKVKISKVDFTTSEELPGATLRLEDVNGNLVEEWESGREPHYIERLKPGKYTLIETIAPEGYMVAEKIEFEVKNTGEIQTVVMVDTYTRLLISKKDITNKAELPGARLELLDADGNVVDKWVSEGKPHYIEKLAPGEYTLIETLAPEGYKVAEKITFVLEPTGTIKTVTMYDKPKHVPDDEPTPTPNRPVSPKTADGAGVVEMTCVFSILSALTLVGVCMKRKKEY